MLAGADAPTGGAYNDTLKGLGGDDTVVGGDGSDTIGGDSGDDVLLGGAGFDFIFGEDGGRRRYAFRLRRRKILIVKNVLPGAFAADDFNI